MDIEKLIDGKRVSTVTKKHVWDLLKYGKNLKFFGRTDVERITGLKSSRASELIKLLLEMEIIESVRGHGKGKYRFLNKC